MARKACSSPSPSDDADLLAQIEAQLRQLSLTVAASELLRLLQEAEAEQLSYSQLLDNLLAVELGARRARKVARRVKRAKLGEVKSLEEFDFSARPKLTPAAVKELLSCRFIDEGRPIICIGKAGTGKTHVAKALAHAACMRGYSVRAAITVDILDELHASVADGTFAKVFRRYTSVDLLVLDEIGYLSLDKQKASNLFRIVSARHPSRAVIVTTNTAFDEWGKFFPNQAQAVATVDRLLDRATVLRFTGKSFRGPKEIIGDVLD